MSTKTLVCDVGSGSVRVAILEYSAEGVLQPEPLSHATKTIQIHSPKTDFYEQSSEEIWLAFIDCCQQCLKNSKIRIESIEALAFSATCSLVILDGDKDLDKDKDKHGDKHDVIMWMDHRSKCQADAITLSGHRVLQQLGGTCSPEFTLSKLIWLKEIDERRFIGAEGFMELPDWMSYRCSTLFGSPESFTRSLCSVVCKWGFDAENGVWPRDLLEQYDVLASLPKFGVKFASPGEPIGILSKSVSEQIGLPVYNPKTVIACPLIDAHAGMLSMLVFGDTSGVWENVLGMISGTSACHMLLNSSRVESKGIWGPYKHAIIPDTYLREAGQSATGKLIDDVIANYFDSVLDKKQLVEVIKGLNRELSETGFLYKSSLLVNPSFHGNRSPIGNYDLKGALYGMTLEKVKLLDLYVAVVESLAYETKYIFEVAQRGNRPEVGGSESEEMIRKIIVTGGLVKNEFYMQLHADVVGCPLATFSAGGADLMLVGASLIAWLSTRLGTNSQANSVNNGGNNKEDIKQLLGKLCQMNVNVFRQGIKVYEPRKEFADYHQKKYQSYRKLLDCCLELSKNPFI